MILEIIFCLIILTEAYVIWNLMRKAELLETWVEDFTMLIENVNDELKTIDSNGSFESDDETGAIFKQIQETVNKLTVLRGEDVDDK
jgi:archaellum component FlaC